MSNKDFEIKDGTLVKYTGKGGKVVIPKGVKIIGQSSFKENKNIISVKMPDSVTLIGKYAFEHCSSLKSVVLSKNLQRIGFAAFNGCLALVKIKLPESLEWIDAAAFWNCDSIKSLVIPQNVKIIGKFEIKFKDKDGDKVVPLCGGLFCGKSWVKRLKVHPGNKNFKIVGNALYRYDMREIVNYLGDGKEGTFVIPDSVHEIAAFAFFNATLTKIIFPEQLWFMGDYALPNASKLTVCYRSFPPVSGQKFPNPCYKEEFLYTGN